MGNDREKFRLEALEPRLLLSASGILDQPVLPVVPDAPSAVVDLTHAGPISNGTVVNAVYDPAADLPDLLAAPPQGTARSERAPAAQNVTIPADSAEIGRASRRERV